MFILNNFHFFFNFTAKARRSVRPVKLSLVTPHVKFDRKTWEVLQRGVHNSSVTYVDFWTNHVLGRRLGRKEQDELVLKALQDKKYQGYKLVAFCSIFNLFK